LGNVGGIALDDFVEAATDGFGIGVAGREAVGGKCKGGHVPWEVGRLAGYEADGAGGHKHWVAGLQMPRLGPFHWHAGAQGGSLEKRQACLASVAEILDGVPQGANRSGLANMALEAFHHGTASGGGRGCALAAIHRQHKRGGADALGHRNADAVEAGDLSQARDASGVEMRAHAGQSVLGRAGAVSSVDFVFR